MPKQSHQKQKLLCLLHILRRRTDEEHPLRMEELLSALAEEGIPAARKSVYSDLEALRELGEDVVMQRKDGHTVYFLGTRALELAKCKLLVDAVQSSRFITEKKSRQLIEKLSGGLSAYQVREMNRQVFVSGRIKSMNESILYNVDALQTALREERRITFRYFDWTVRKTRAYHRDGGLYEVSPWSVVWQSENYYLIACERPEDGLRHFRVDKMEGITVTALPRAGEQQYRDLDTARYTDTTFGMFSGEPEAVELSVENRLAGVIIDRFGREPVFRPESGTDRFRVTVRVIPSPLFFGWALSFGSGVRVLSPASARDALRRQALDALGE